MTAFFSQPRAGARGLRLVRSGLCLMALSAGLLTLPAAAQKAPAKGVDYIVAVVNNELVTQIEVAQRLERTRDDARRQGQRLPDDAELRRQVVQALIDERVMVTYARDAGQRVDDAELDRAVANLAAMNQLPSVEVLRERLKADGMDWARFRANLRDQMMAERIREREVQARIRVSDSEIEDWLAARKAAQGSKAELNIAQILVSLPEGASAAVIAERKAKAAAALARVKGGEDFAKVAADVSEDSNRQRGGEIGSRPVDRLPDLFVESVAKLAPGDLLPEVVQSGVGFHVLKLVARSDPDALTVTQTRARHILMRPNARLTPEGARRRLAEMRDQILSGRRKFEELARSFSEDGSAEAGGDLGWASPGMFVPEFEQAMEPLVVGGMSDPVMSRFGVHLIQVTDRRQVPLEPLQAREQARIALRAQKYDAALEEWLTEIRSRAYIEMREPPL